MPGENHDLPAINLLQSGSILTDMIRYLAAAMVLVVLAGGALVFGADGTAGVETAIVTSPDPVVSSQPAPSSGILVKFNATGFNSSDAFNSSLAEVNTAIGATIETDYSSLGLPGWYLVTLPEGMNTTAGIAYYLAIPFVDEAEENAMYSIASEPSTSGPVELDVWFNASAFPSGDQLRVYANATHVAIQATLVQDYASAGLAGLDRVSLPANTTPEAALRYYADNPMVRFAGRHLGYGSF